MFNLLKVLGLKECKYAWEHLRRDFLKGCRPFIGLDGCLVGFKKRPVVSSSWYRSHDGNYPIAWAFVEGESKDSWTWFIELLFFDLGIEDGENWTIVSGEEKSLVGSIGDLIANIEHRHCEGI